MIRHEEIERKYDVDEATVVPPLGDLGRVEPQGESHLEAEYFDTAHGDLAAHRITLRRRQGGSDEGWHVKIPAKEGRSEFHWPLDNDQTGPRQVPVELLDTVRVHVRDRELRAIARIQTRRAITHLLDDTGRELLEVADDTVTASDIGSGVVRVWREWEAELLDGAPESADERLALLDSVEHRLIAAGARPAASASKLATALGRTSLAEPAPPRDLGPDSAASEVLLTALESLLDELKLADPQIRRDEHDSVHQARTRIRRVRSLLATYRAVLDRAATDGIRDELQWLGALLGEARDAEVMRDRARALLNDHGAAAGVTGDALADGWSVAYRKAHARVLTELSGERYFRLLDSLDELVAKPPLGEDAYSPLGEVASKALRRDLKRVLRRAEKAEEAESDSDRTTFLHDTRKAAKRLRYAAEAVTEGEAAVLGPEVRAAAAAAEAIHDLLGEHRDSQLLQDHLRATAEKSGSAFGYGVLYEIERHSAALCLAEYAPALRELKRFRKKL